ncbi:MAG: hypothetical protein ACJAYU_000905 [Bradymonadia bacterium]
MATSARFVLGGDNGEFATMFATGGVPHPSGYPAFAVYLRLMSWMPGVSPAHGAAISTAILGIAAVVMVRAACRAWGASLQSSTLAAVTFGLSPLMWKLSTHAEVFALHALLAASILRVTGPSARLSLSRRALLLGLLAGLGLANNHSLVTIAPLGFYGAYRVLIESPQRLRALGLALGGMCLGLSPYLYLVLVARSGADVLVWGDTSTASGLLHHFLRADYGTTQLAISEESSSALAHISRLLVELAKNLSYVPVVFIVIGVATLFGARRSRPNPGLGLASASVKAPRLHESTVREDTRPSTTSVGRRPALPMGHGVAWLLTWICVGPLFIGMFNLPLEGLATIVVERFYLLPMVLLCVPLARGIDRVLEGQLRAVEVYSPVCIGLLSLFIVTGLDHVRDHHRGDVESYLLNSLNTVEPDSVILGTGDHRIYGFHYVQRVLHQREDVTYIDPLLLNYQWYRSQIEELLGMELVGISEGSVNSVELAEGLYQAGRSIYLTNRFSNAIVQGAPNYPIGTLIRIGAPPSPARLEAMNVSVAANYRYPSGEATDPDGWAASVNAEYTRPWRVLAQAYESMGDFEAAERCRNHGVIIPSIP